MGDIARRRRSQLATPDWKSVPWEREEKSIKDKLVDILMDIPGHLEDLDNVRAAENPYTRARIRKAALFACGANIASIAAWEDEVGPELQIYDYLVSGLPLPIPKTDVDTALLQLTTLYWVVGILLYSTYGMLKKDEMEAETPQPQTSQPTSYLSPPSSIASGASGIPSPGMVREERPPKVDHRRDPRLLAYKIAYSVHLFWEPAAGAFGNHVGLFPLGVAMRFLASVEPIQTSEAYAQMRQLFRRPFLGTVVGEFLSNLQKQTPKPELRNMQGDAGIEARAKVWWNEGEKPRASTPS